MVEIALLVELMARDHRADQAVAILVRIEQDHISRVETQGWRHPTWRGNLAIQPLLLPRLALARKPLGQEDLEQRLVRNVAPIRQYFEILNHGDREAQ